MTKNVSLILTNARILIINEDKKIQRIIDIQDLYGLTKNPENDADFTINVRDQHKYSISSEDRELILNLIYEAYKKISNG